MEYVILNQRISLISKIFFLIPIAFLTTILSIYSWYYSFIYILVLAILFIKKDYVIRKNFQNTIQIRLFNIIFLKKQLRLIKPEYISLFKQPFKQTAGFGFTTFNETKFKMYVIKFFNNNSKSTVFMTHNRLEAENKVKALSEMLGVRVNNTLKSST